MEADEVAKLNSALFEKMASDDPDVEKARDAVNKFTRAQIRYGEALRKAVDSIMWRRIVETAGEHGGLQCQ